MTPWRDRDETERVILQAARMQAELMSTAALLAEFVAALNEATAEVELGHRSTGQHLGVQLEQAPGRLGETLGVEDLRTDVRVQAEEDEGEHR